MCDHTYIPDPSRDKKSKARTAVERMCGLSTVVTPAGASLTMYREIRSYANSIWDDNNNNNNNNPACCGHKEV